MATQHLFDEFHDFSIPQSSNPIAALHALEDKNSQMEEKGMGRIPDTVLHARFVRAACRVKLCIRNTTNGEKLGQGRDQSRGQHAVFQPTPKELGAALVPTA